MGMTETQQHEERRQRLWMGVAIAVAGCEDCKDKRSPALFADAALERFDQKFPKPKMETTAVTGPKCEACRHYNSELMACTNDDVSEAYCYRERRIGVDCGPEGKLWKPIVERGL